MPAGRDHEREVSQVVQTSHSTRLKQRKPSVLCQSPKTERASIVGIKSVAVFVFAKRRRQPLLCGDFFFFFNVVVCGRGVKFPGFSETSATGVCGNPAAGNVFRLFGAVTAAAAAASRVKTRGYKILRWRGRCLGRLMD